MYNTRGKRASDQARGVDGSAPHSLVYSNLGAYYMKGAKRDEKNKIPNNKQIKRTSSR
jgi:hypothetical protein